MSVNEVRRKSAVDEFVVRGTGPLTARTFCIGNEDHTLGNALRHVLLQDASVDFAGYSVPHPSEPIVQIRVQTTTSPTHKEAPTAVQALRTACQTLIDQCDIVNEKLEALFPNVREDRIETEKRLLEEGYAGDDADEDESEDVIMKEE